jgi:multidrug resistance efflux pump
MKERDILQKEEQILEQEKEILKEIKKEEKVVLKAERRIVMAVLGLLFIICLAASGLIYWRYSSGRISIDKSGISAPRIELGPSAAGVLQEIDVHVGDTILPDTVVARVDNQIIKAKAGGLVIAVQNDIGKRFNPGESVVSMIDPQDLRVVGQLEEDKGLQDVRVGQSAVFTVDTFGARKFYGTVDEISPTSHDSGVVFNISDQREKKVFDVKVRYDVKQYPELKNGMSAKITILKD